MHTCLCIVLCYYCCHVENVDAWFLLVVLLLKYVLLDSWIILWMRCIFNDDDDDDDTLQQLYSLLFRLLELGWVLSLNQLTSVSFAGIKYNLAFDWYYVRLFSGELVGCCSSYLVFGSCVLTPADVIKWFNLS